MARLNIERQKELEPDRLEYAAKKICALGYNVIQVIGEKHIDFIFKGETVRLYPYSGWHTGKSIKDGRGLQNLLNQIKK